MYFYFFFNLEKNDFFGAGFSAGSSSSNGLFGSPLSPYFARISSYFSFRFSPYPSKITLDKKTILEGLKFEGGALELNDVLANQGANRKRQKEYSPKIPR